MPITFTITNNSKEALAFAAYAKTLDFVKTEEIEVDEYGIPIAHRDFIMSLSRDIKKKGAKRYFKRMAEREAEETDLLQKIG
jgi:hypothetical protein